MPSNTVNKSRHRFNLVWFREFCIRSWDRKNRAFDWVADAFGWVSRPQLFPIRCGLQSPYKIGGNVAVKSSFSLGKSPISSMSMWYQESITETASQDRCGSGVMTPRTPAHADRLSVRTCAASRKVRPVETSTPSLVAAEKQRSRHRFYAAIAVERMLSSSPMIFSIWSAVNSASGPCGDTSVNGDSYNSEMSTMPWSTSWLMIRFTNSI